MNPRNTLEEMVQLVHLFKEYHLTITDAMCVTRTAQKINELEQNGRRVTDKEIMLILGGEYEKEV